MCAGLIFNIVCTACDQNWDYQPSRWNHNFAVNILNVSLNSFVS